jgi:transposase
MKSNVTNYISIDGSKLRLDIHGLEGLTKVPNTPEGHKIIIKKLKPEQHHVALEATGGYEDRFIFQLHNKGIKVSRIEPPRVRDYAKSLSRKAKYDKIDAQSIAEYAQHVNPTTLPVPSTHQCQLKAPCSAR